MKIYVDTKINSRGIQRVPHALKKYKPDWVEIATTPEEADLVVFHVNGRLKHLKAAIKKHNKPYAVIQYCLKSTMNPDPLDWTDVWRKAKVVWSYYDLPYKWLMNFYQAPLGADSNIFKIKEIKTDYTVCTTGISYLSESVREVFMAAREVGVKVAHLGPDLGYEGVDYYTDLEDWQVADLYNRCVYISGLRRAEGFELPVAEGILCGCRPILFDQPHYRQWFDYPLATFIPEQPREKVIESLVQLFSHPYTSKEWWSYKEMQERFNWDTIIKGFYQHLL